MAELPLVRHVPQAPFAYWQKRLVSTREFLSGVVDLSRQLPERRYVINLCTDRFLFAAGFAAALVRGQVSLMPPTHTPDVVERLVRYYPDLYCPDEAAAAVDFQTNQKVSIPAVAEERIEPIV